MILKKWLKIHLIKGFILQSHLSYTEISITLYPAACVSNSQFPNNVLGHLKYFKIKKIIPQNIADTLTK